jgi:hypothetical protein
MARVLLLTSPELHGADVEHLQAELKSNTTKTDYLPGHSEPTGVFDELTAQACYRAQYWYGYAKPNHNAGTPLRKYLRGDVPLTAPMRTKREARQAEAAAVPPLRERALREALKHVGLKEGSNNSNPFGKWYGADNVPWCAEFWSYCNAKAGSKRVSRLKRWAYTPYMVADARAGVNGLTIVHDPKPGDAALFGPNANGVAYHVEFFEKWISGRTLWGGVGGNTGPSSVSNGGMVAHWGTPGFPARNASAVLCWVHLSG